MTSLHRVELHLTPTTLQRIDTHRGPAPRATWITYQLEQLLDELELPPAPLAGQSAPATKPPPQPAVGAKPTRREAPPKYRNRVGPKRV